MYATVVFLGSGAKIMGFSVNFSETGQEVPRSMKISAAKIVSPEFVVRPHFGQSTAEKLFRQI